MKGKLLGFALALLSVATIGVVQLQTKAYVDGDPDCDKYAVIWCGSYSPSATKNAIQHGAKNSPNLAKIFGALGIQASEIGGNYKNGIVYQNGNVVVDGKVVATNARMAARNLGGSAIAGTNAGVMSVSHMGSAQTAMVKFDSNGRFVHAIMKPCGNPVVATPTQPKPVATCDGLKVEKIERTKFRFTGDASAKYGAKIKGYKFEVHKGSKIVDTLHSDSKSVTYNQTTAGDYKVRLTVKTSEGEKTNAKCVKTFTVQEQPEAICKVLNVQTISRTEFKFTAKAEVNRAKVNGYEFRIFRGSDQIATKTVNTSNLSATVNYTQNTPGEYKVRAVVKTSLGDRFSPECVKPFTVTPPEEHPGVKVEKKVNGVELAQVAVNEEFTYQIAVTNTGDVDLKNVDVTDTPEAGVTLLDASAGSISGNTWTYTIPVLKVGETKNYTITAKVPEYLSGKIKNTVCVDATEVPGEPDDCDNAYVEVPKPHVKINKLVDNVDYKLVGVNVEFTYQIAVTNDGEVVLKNAKVSDEAPAGVTFLSASAGTVTADSWNHTIPSLAVGETKNFTITAKVPEFLAGKIVNTACVDATEVPGQPDDCDDATVEVPKKVWVCNPETGEIIKVEESEAGNYLPVDSPECQDIVVCNLETREVVTIKKSEFDESVYSTNLADCEEENKVHVCNPETGKIIQVDESEADNYLPVDSDECKEVRVCRLSDKTVVTIRKSDYNDTDYTTDLSRCEETPKTPETPPELPTTGAADVIMQVAGVTSLAGAGAYYLASRRSRT